MKTGGLHDLSIYIYTYVYRHTKHIHMLHINVCSWFMCAWVFCAQRQQAGQLSPGSGIDDHGWLNAHINQSSSFSSCQQYIEFKSKCSTVIMQRFSKTPIAQGQTRLRLRVVFGNGFSLGPSKYTTKQPQPQQQWHELVKYAKCVPGCAASSPLTTCVNKNQAKHCNALLSWMYS